MTVAAQDMLVDTKRPDLLDKVLQTFGAVVIEGITPEGYLKIDDHYVVRCFSDIGFIQFAISQQGYGKIVRVYDGLYSDEDSETQQARD